MDVLVLPKSEAVVRNPEWGGLSCSLHSVQLSEYGRMTLTHSRSLMLGKCYALLANSEAHRKYTDNVLV